MLSETFLMPSTLKDHASMKIQVLKTLTTAEHTVKLRNLRDWFQNDGSQGELTKVRLLTSKAISNQGGPQQKKSKLHSSQREQERSIQAHERWEYASPVSSTSPMSQIDKKSGVYTLKSYHWLKEKMGINERDIKEYMKIPFEGYLKMKGLKLFLDNDKDRGETNLEDCLKEIAPPKSLTFLQDDPGIRDFRLEDLVREERELRREAVYNQELQQYHRTSSQQSQGRGESDPREQSNSGKDQKASFMGRKSSRPVLKEISENSETEDLLDKMIEEDLDNIPKSHLERVAREMKLLSEDAEVMRKDNARTAVKVSQRAQRNRERREVSLRDVWEPSAPQIPSTSGGKFKAGGAGEQAEESAPPKWTSSVLESDKRGRRSMSSSNQGFGEDDVYYSKKFAEMLHKREYSRSKEMYRQASQRREQELLEKRSPNYRYRERRSSKSPRESERRNRVRR